MQIKVVKQVVLQTVLVNTKLGTTPNYFTTTTFVLSGDYDVSDKIGVTFTLGAESRRDIFDQNGLASTGQQVFNVLRHFNFAQNDEIQSFSERNILGVYAQTEWDYDRTVYLTLAARKDWVSNLAKENASITYPSASVAVIPTKFIDGLKRKTINILSYVPVTVLLPTSLLVILLHRT